MLFCIPEENVYLIFKICDGLGYKERADLISKKGKLKRLINFTFGIKPWL